MTRQAPTTFLDTRFSSPGASATPWTAARDRLEHAALYWLTTVRPDHRPHVTPLVGVWLDDAFYFCTGDDERKAHNLARNAHCAITVGSDDLTGLDVVLEGDAAHVTDEPTLRRLADAYAAKYGTQLWNFTVRDGAFYQDGRVPVYVVRPETAFGFDKGDSFGQTRWRF